MDIYPGGYEDSDDGYVAVDLCNMSNKSIKIQYGFIVRDTAGKEVVYYAPGTDEFGAERDLGNSWYTSNFSRRSTLLDAIIEGSLIIEIRMKLVEASKLPKQFIPTNPLNKKILNKFNDEESADVIFEVGSGSKEGGNTCKKAKISTATFYAHRFIVQDISTTLAEMCKPSGGGDATIYVTITDVKPNIFRHMLYYFYGGKLTEEELKVDAKDIIDAADKYGVVSLKLEAEVSYVKSTTLTNDNLIDNLLYADAMNCALLKEAVMDFILKNKKDIMDKVSFDNVPGSMITDILAAVARGEPKEEGDGNNGGIDYHKMRVGTLRKMLDEKGLDVDGSREAMIALLKENA